MTKIRLKRADLHTALFLAGTNLGLKLDPILRTDLDIEYDRDRKELWVKLKGAFAIVPSTNVAAMELWAADVDNFAKEVFLPLDTDLPEDIAKPPRAPAPKAVRDVGPFGQQTLAARPVTEIAETTAAAPKPKAKAQVSSPTSHVFEGPGAGVTGQEKR